MFGTLFSLIVLVVVLGGLTWYGSRKTAMATPTRTKAGSRPYTKVETAHLHMLERRLTEGYASTEFGPDYGKWGENVLKTLTGEDLRRLKEWYADAYYELNQMRVLDAEQVAAKGWVTASLVLIARVEPMSSENLHESDAESSHNAAS
ncbi:hypothetical protein AB0Y14_12325 [Rothia sp. HC945]|uniref:hypothetical protein n=1 Tax=Rothia sp. HC945 TaxID=3171170 RepID=UPI003F2601DB